MPRTLREYNAAIKNLTANLPAELSGPAILSAANGLVRRMKDRVFNQGLDAKNKILQERYSTRALWASKQQFFKPSVFKNVGKRGLPTKKTMYFADGYAGLRKSQGLQTSRVNWLYSGRTRRALVARQNGLRVLIGFNTERAKTIRKGLEKRIGRKVFRPSEEEKLEYRASVLRHLKAVNSKYLKA